MIEAVILSLSVLQPSPASVQQQQPLSDRGWAWSPASAGRTASPLTLASDWSALTRSRPLIGPGGAMVTDAGQAGQPLVPLTHIVKARLARPGRGWERLLGWARSASSWLHRPDSLVQPVTAQPTHISKLELAKIPKILKNKDMSWIKSEVIVYQNSLRHSDSIIVQEQEQDVLDFWNIGNHAHLKTGSWSDTSK